MPAPLCPGCGATLHSLRDLASRSCLVTEHLDTLQAAAAIAAPHQVAEQLAPVRALAEDLAHTLCCLAGFCQSEDA